ncbi:hypothetical protein [Pseudomonas sp. Marseille-Q0931]|uniref:hypothetical protein n=1 Tax=Pseudomonas sp. Marseille-Q0931 TaxID=2697507 RepID=UPI0023B89E81|nr:hypothetical protein [Pseudomonas sp. Marseille-Q0931]
MSQPFHLRAPTARIAPRPAPSSSLDDWSSLSTLAMPILTPACHDMPRVSWLRPISTLIAKLPPARKA